MNKTTRMRSRDNTSAVAMLALSALLGASGFAARSMAAVMPSGPAMINAGPVAITPTTGLEYRYRDNIYLQENSKTDSSIYIASPAVNAALQDRDNLYQLNYQGEVGWYQENSSNDKNDYFNNTFSGSAHMELSARWMAEASASWAALHEDRGTGISEGVVGLAIPEPVEYDQSDVDTSLQYGSGEGSGRLLFSAGYMDRQYQNFEDFTRVRDREEITFATTFFYPVAPKTDVLIDYAYKKIDYPNPFEERPALDSDENSLLVGAEWEITPNLTSSARVGYQDKNFNESERTNWEGLAWRVSLAMQPREQDSVVVETSRAPDETSAQGDFIKRSDLTVGWTHDWSDLVYTELSALYGKDEYEQSINNRDDDVYNVSVRVGYQFRRWANVFAGYSYDEKDSNAQNLSYQDNTIMIGVDFSL